MMVKVTVTIATAG